MAEAGYSTPPGFELRPPVPSDAPALARLSLAAFGEGFDRDLATVERRARNLLASPHPSSLVAETSSGAIAGLAITRDLDPIVLLAWAAVDPAFQGQGLLRALLTGWPGPAPGRTRLILSSSDPAAMRAYAHLGLQVLPALSAGGILRPGAATSPGEVALMTPGAAASVLAELGEQVRGTAYPPDDVAVLEAQGDLVHVFDGGAHGCGAAVRHDGIIRLLVATTEHAARMVLQDALAAVPPGHTVHLGPLRAGMDWAVDAAVNAGLVLSPEGPVFADAPLSDYYLPNGSLG